MSHPYQDVFYDTIENILIENLEEYFKDILKRVDNIKSRYKL